ncbi:hypothetical protein ACIQH0_20385 [Streptomyces griseus]|uniref:hypothetical protein n=1 Tax=Streptomyces griseus TaxID=1911 RepID=UPI00081AF7BB|nr:hypothetical protein GA0115261_1001911 [Streptomyces sp. OspMP-M43]
METSPPDPDDAAFGLVEQYDSIEDPYLRSEFLDAVGTTRSRINHLRLLRDRAAARSIAAAPEPEPEEVAPETDGGKGSQRPVPPLPNRSRTTDVATRPPNNTGGTRRRNRRRRNRERP